MTTEEAVGRIAGSGGRRQWPETHEMKCGAGGDLGVAVRGKGLAGGGGSQNTRRFCESRIKAVNALPLSPFNNAAV